MPLGDEMPGGTLGANEPLAHWASTRYTYATEHLEVIRSHWHPQDSWIEKYQHALYPDDDLHLLSEPERQEVELIKDKALNGESFFEEMASKFIRSLSSSRGKATPALQKMYLQRIVSLTEELNTLLVDVSMQDTPADLFAMMRRLAPKLSFETELELKHRLIVVQSLATWRLKNGLSPSEESVFNLTGKNTFERFRFATSIVQFYERSTGKVATAWVKDTAEGEKSSEMISFLMAVMNPVLQSVGYPPVSSESARKEIQEVKKVLASGLDPSLPHFGSGFYSGS